MSSATTTRPSRSTSASSTGAGILLAKAVGDQQLASVGSQTGGRVFIFIETDDFWRDYNGYKARGVVFVRAPQEQPYGTVAVFQDLYGNLWDLVQLKDAGAPPNN